MTLPKAFDLRKLRNFAETAAVAAFGGWLFTALHFPAGWLTGALAFAAGASLAGRPMFIPTPLARLSFFSIGITIGSVATPETLRGIATWPLSVVIASLGMICAALAATSYLRRMHGWETTTALLASSPGGLSQVMALATEFKADVRGVAIVQVMRVIILALGVPAAFALFGLVGPARMPQGAMSILDAPGVFALLGAASVAVALLRLGFPGGLIFGPMLVSALLHGFDYVHVSLPVWAANAAVVGLGATNGSRFANITPRMLLAYLAAALGSFVVAVMVAGAFGALVVALVPVHVQDVTVAFAPGSVDAMMILALALHLDPVYVGAHHLTRIFTVSLALPIAVRTLNRRERAGPVPPPTGEDGGR